MGPMKNKQLFVVLGMHRSGTSVITRALQVLGVDLGGNLLAPLKGDNDKGFWEDVEVNSLNIELLKALGEDWHTLCPLEAEDLASFPKISEFKFRAKEILLKRLSVCDFFGLKNPRICRLLPFWQEVFSELPAKVNYVIAYRNPMSVARSLAKRNELDFEKSYYLWLEHMLQSLALTFGCSRIVVNYDSLIDEPAEQLRRIAKKFDLPFNLQSEEYLTFKSDFIERSLRHTQFQAEDLDYESSAPTIVKKTNNLLYELGTDIVDLDGPKALSLIKLAAEQFFDNKPLLSFAKTLDKRVDVLAKALTDRDGQITHLAKALTDRDGQNADLKLSINSLIMQIDIINEDLKKILFSDSFMVTQTLLWLGKQPLNLIRFTLNYFRNLFYEFEVGFKHGKNLWEEAYIQSIKSPLFFEYPDSPTVSIVIPVFNNWRFTQACLRSIQENSGVDISYEVIIADDCSKDETKKKLSKIPGLKIISNEINLGFLRNCNNAIKYARGRYVVLLNNDTEVSANWLKLMLDVFSNFDKVGVVAGKLIYPDGLVQEAGGIMMSNGWGHPYGRYADPENYEFNYVKDVACAIGACLMIDKSLFESIGGFDEQYAPAYYEEFDFEFLVRAAGYRVMYQPAVRITHHESISAGAEFRDAQSIINHDKFSQKWAEELECSYYPISESDLYLARDLSINQKRILVIEDMVPPYDQHAGGLCIYQYIKLLLDMKFKIVFLPDNLKPTQPYTMDLQQMGVEVIYGEFDFKSWFGENGSTFDYCWLCRPDVSIKYIDTIRSNSAAKIFYFTHDLHYLREYRRYELEGIEWHLEESKRYKKIESEIFRHADIVLTPSYDEEILIKEISPDAKVLTVPLFIYESNNLELFLDSFDYESRRNILFLGGYLHSPNVDAVLYFANEVMPLIRLQLPDVEFHIAGSNVPAEIQELESPSFHVRGYVADLSELYQDFRVFVAPLRYGAGVKGKIISSLNYGVPVVTTSIGNEGINLVNEDQALIGNSPQELADLVCKIYLDKKLWVHISRKGKEVINENFSIQAAKKIIQEALSK